MVFYKLTKIIIFLAFLAVKSSFPSDKTLLDLPPEIIQHISSFLSEKENGILRKVCQSAKGNVDEVYKKNIKKQFGNNKNSTLQNLLADTPKIPIAPFQHHYTHKIMHKVCTEYLKRDGFLVVAQGSCLEGYLRQNYKPFSMYTYLKNRPEETGQFFKILFEKDMPEEQYDLALNLLIGCLPTNHIYVEKNKKTISTCFIEKFKEILLKSIISKKIKYFLLGIDKEYAVLNDGEHIIVINQSTQDDIEKLKDFPHETIILNADQEIFTSRPLPKNMKNLILVNGNNQCWRIADNFVNDHLRLESCFARGLVNVKKIGGNFLYYCKKLRTFNTTGFSNLIEIGWDFLVKCKNLQAFDSTSLNKVEKIGEGFLDGCMSLPIFEGRDLTSLKEIGSYFLSDCNSLVIFDSTSFHKVEKIGTGFLFGCENLTIFDKTYLRNVKEIGKSFLFACVKLDRQKIKQEILPKKKYCIFF